LRIKGVNRLSVSGALIEKVMSQKIFIIIFLVCATGVFQDVNAQVRRSDRSAVTYEELYDDPYAINTLFIHFQPLYTELFVANLNAGFGLQVEYHYKNKLEFRAHARKPYARATDFSRENASKNSNIQNKAAIYNYYELGATYHVKDWEDESQSKVILYSNRYKGVKWAANVPEHIIIPTKVRKIYGVRLGGLMYDTSTDLNRVMEKQEVTLPEIGNEEVSISGDANVYGNLDAKAIYLGGSMSWIKNFAIKPDKSYGTLGNDLMFTTYLDFIFAPVVSVDDIFYEDAIFSSKNIKTNKFGFRAGMDGKFNREWGWAYGGEIGFRPGIKTRGFYATIKISFPVFSTSLDHSKEAFSK